MRITNVLADGETHLPTQEETALKEKISLKSIWDNLEEIILIPSLTISVVIIFIQVCMRYIFNNSLSWSEELARYMFIWQVWLGISLAAKKKSHLRITLIFGLVKGNAAKVLNLIVDVIFFVFGLLITKYGMDVVMQIAHFQQKSAALQLPMQYVYAAIPVGALLMSIRLLEDLVRGVKGMAAKREDGEVK